jgi:hypothetical protein
MQRQRSGWRIRLGTHGLALQAEAATASFCPLAGTVNLWLVPYKCTMLCTAFRFGFFLELQEEVPGEFTFFQKFFDDKFFLTFFKFLHD